MSGGGGAWRWCGKASERDQGVRGASIGDQRGSEFQAIVGYATLISLQIPKCEKGRSIESALKMIAGKEGRKTRTIWAETKYDGER